MSNSCHLQRPNLWVRASDKWLLRHCTCEINWPAGSLELWLRLSPSIRHCGSEVSQLYGCDPCQPQEEQRQSMKHFRKPLPKFPPQQVSILFQGNIWTVSAEEGPQPCALEELCQASLQLQKSGGREMVFLPTTGHVAFSLSREFS